MSNEPKKQNYLTGAAILAATVAITKVFGFIYKIPIYNLLGDVGTAHFQVTYTIYTLLLTLSMAGVPVAVSRLIAEARATGRPNQAKRIYHVALVAFGALGMIATSIMLFFPLQLSSFMEDPEAALGVQVLAPSVFFVCIVSVLRGYAQGYGDMVPTSISQIMEVVIKLVLGVSIAWVLSRQGAPAHVVSAGAIVGVTVGLGLSIPIMAAYKRRIMRRYADENRINDAPTSRWDTLRQIVRVSVPIMLSSSVLNIINLIDTKLVLGRLKSGAGFDPIGAEELYGAYSKGLSLFNMPSAFITPVCVAVVPAIAAAIARRDRDEARGSMESCLKLTNLLALPAGVGMCVLAEPIYRTLFPGSHPKGPALLAVLGIASYFVCTYLITNAVLQASGHERLGLIALPMGGLVKIVVNYVMVGNPAINISGAPVGTVACYVLITLINIGFMALKLPEKPDLLKITIRPAVCTAFMGLTAWAVYGLVHRVLGEGRLGLVLALGIAIVAAVLVYIVLSLALKAVTREDILLLPKGEKLAKLLRMK
ncbi:MAG: putative polysaccharide biosynthesis protein [bacterium]